MARRDPWAESFFEASSTSTSSPPSSSASTSSASRSDLGAAHTARIIDQFSQQAVAFSNAPALASERMFQQIIDATKANSADIALDVACGPGLLVAALAEKVARVEGLDITEAMIERAKVKSQEKNLKNTSFRLGSALTLPYESNSFSLVTTRLSFHHFQDPLAALREMKRVCAPGGRVCVIDFAASDDAIKAYNFNQFEIRRDPSHTKALQLKEHLELFEKAGLSKPTVTPTLLEDETENLLQRSYPTHLEDRDLLRKVLNGALNGDKLGMNLHLSSEGRLRYATPCAILVSYKA